MGGGSIRTPAAELGRDAAFVLMGAYAGTLAVQATVAGGSALLLSDFILCPPPPRNPWPDATMALVATTAPFVGHRARPLRFGLVLLIWVGLAVAAEAALLNAVWLSHTDASLLDFLERYDGSVLGIPTLQVKAQLVVLCGFLSGLALCTSPPVEWRARAAEVRRVSAALALLYLSTWVAQREVESAALKAAWGPKSRDFVELLVGCGLLACVVARFAGSKRSGSGSAPA